MIIMSIWCNPPIVKCRGCHSCTQRIESDLRENPILVDAYEIFIVHYSRLGLTQTCYASTESGSAYNYDLLFVVLWASLIALFFQVLSVKLAIATGKDLAQASKVRYSEKMNYVLWLVAETAIMATDLAEVLGSAIALKLLFGLRLEIGVMVTAIDVVIVFAMQVKRLLQHLLGFVFPSVTLIA